MTKFVYFFDESGALASDSDPKAARNLLGGKGAGLAEMTAAGLPVPSGFTDVYKRQVPRQSNSL